MEEELEHIKNERIILGIDISTTCLGISIVKYANDKVEILKVSYVKPKISKKIKGTEALFLKARQFKEEFIEKHKDFGITDIVIEEPLPSSQNNNTVTTLMRFNGMISQSIYEALGVVPVYISSYDARKFAFPELMAIRKFNKKEEIYPTKTLLKNIKDSKVVLFGSYPFSCQKKFILWNKISELYPGINWFYNKKGELKTENFDASDSLVCILGYINKEKFYDDVPVITESKFDKERNIIYYKLKYCNNVYDKMIELI